MNGTSEYDTHQIFSSFNDDALKFFEVFFQRFKQNTIRAITDYSTLMEALVQEDAASSENPEERLCALWNQTEDLLAGFQKWIDFSDLPGLGKTVSNEGRNRFQEFIAELPETLTYEWPAHVLDTQSGDTFRISAFKASRKTVRMFAHIRLGIINAFRPDKKFIGDEIRTVYLQSFMKRNLLVPIMEISQSFSDRLLSIKADYLAGLHGAFEKTIVSVLGLDTDKDSWADDLDRIVMNVSAAVTQGLPDLTRIGQDLDTLFDETQQTVLQCVEKAETAIAHASKFSGTWAYPSRHNIERIFQKRLKQAGKNTDHAYDLWENHFRGEKLDWTHEIALNKIQIRVARKTMEIMASVREKIDAVIIPQCDHASETLTETRKRLSGIEQASEWVKKKDMAREGHALLQGFRKELIPGLARRVLGAGIGLEISGIKGFTEELIKGLSETHTVFRKRDTLIPPHSELVDIPIRDLFETEFLVKYQSALSGFQQTLHIRLDDMINGMSDIREVVEFNLESSFSLMSREKDASDACQMAVQGIDRSIVQLDSLMKQIRSLPDDIRQDLKNAAYKWMAEVQNILDNDRLISLKIKLVKAMTRERIHDEIKRAREKGASFVRTIWTGVGVIRERFREKRLELRSFLGLSLPDEDIQVQFTQFLQETRDKLNDLPYVYQQLFQIEPLTDLRLFQARTPELQQLKDIIPEHLKGKTGAFAVIGERGSGKTTLLNLMKFDIPETCPCHKVEFNTTIHSMDELMVRLTSLCPGPPLESLETMGKRLMELDLPQVVVIENIQYLFVRTMDGFDIIESFLALLNRTRNHVTWICSSTLYGWEYLDKVMAISGYFQKVITLKPFGREDIESTIMARHRMTGYKLTFTAPKRIHLSRKYKKLDSDNDRQAHLKKLFFGQIQNVASGNISVAILFWLRSIEKIREHELIMSSQVDFNVTFLSFLSTDDRFTLGAVIQHNLLGAWDHARIFRNPVQKSTLALQNLSNMGILQEADGLFKVHPFLYRHVVRSLKLQNIIH